MTGQRPRLKRRIRLRKSGKVVVYFFYDMRPEGKKDIPLGKDYEAALKKWDELHHDKPRIAGTIKEALERWEGEVLPTYTNEGTKRTYRQNLRAMERFFGPLTWDRVTFPILKGYLKKRSAKTQANRELSCLQVIWNWARGDEELSRHSIPAWPAAGMEKSRWKNKETPRRFEVTDEIFDSIHAQAEPMLKDCMDLASATGMRLTDCRTIRLPKDDWLRLKANKTGKATDFDLRLSQVLPELIERRHALAGALHTMLLSMPSGKPVTESMLRGAYDRAREKAAARAREVEDEELAEAIEAMYLRDCRKYAADKAESLEEASELLQHSSKRVTQVHYRTRAERRKPVR